jgi:RimJ/RimL family protein N-acetyltransferase
LVRAGRGFFQHIGTAMGLRRLQFMVHSRHLQAIRFAETLYFKKEATLARYGPDGSDYYVMTRFYS